MSNTLTSKVSGRMSSRGWAIALGIGAVVLAAILLVVYLDRYRDRVAGENAPRPCCRRTGSSRPARRARSSRRQGMYTSTTLPQKEVVVGAIDDPAYLSGRAAVADIFPGPSSPPRRSRPATRRPSTRRSRGRARVRDLDRRRPRRQLAGDAGRLGRRLHLGRRDGEALPPERQGARRPRRFPALPVAAT